LVPRPEIIAHRGTPRERPENTLPSFLRALELGADALELDVHATADGVVVVHHDPIPRATTTVPGLAGRRIERLTHAELRTFSVADGIGIPTLAEVLQAAADRATVYVEIKGRGIEAPVVECVGRSRAECAVHSFDHRAVRRVRELAPALPTGILLDSYLVDPVAALAAAGARDLWQHWEQIDAPLVAAVGAAGGRVIAWTVNGVAEAEALVALGVAGVCSDLSGEMGRALRR
jgi:glycerophosphoryl diester phosphodiesterase